MKHHAVLLMAGLLWACAPEQDASVETPSTPTVEIPVSLALTDGGDGPWTLDVTLSEPGPVFFSRSNGDYRRGTYTALSDGTALDRLGGFDTILMPADATQAHFEIEPYTDVVRADYTPFIPFSDGGLAMYTGQFELLRAESTDAIEALDGSLRNWRGQQLAIPLTLRSDRQILVDGYIVENEVELTVTGNGEYVYLGTAPLTRGDAFIGVIDPGLPDWLTEGLDRDLSTVFSALEDRFGYGLSEPATLFFAFRGYDHPGLSNKGSALPGNVLALETSGQALQNPDERLRQYFHWFFAHEAVHLFQQKLGKGAAGPDIAWIHEGGANAMAGRLLVESGLRSRDVREANLARSFRACHEAMSGKTLAQTIREGRVGAYDCGEIIAIISDAALPEHDLYDLWSDMVAHSDEEGRYDADDYFAALSNLGASGDLVEQLRNLTTDIVTDVGVSMKGLLDAVGLEITTDSGQVTRISLPG